LTSKVGILHKYLKSKPRGKACKQAVEMLEDEDDAPEFIRLVVERIPSEAAEAMQGAHHGRSTLGDWLRLPRANESNAPSVYSHLVAGLDVDDSDATVLEVGWSLDVVRCPS
jgi:hypothetical protein